MAEQIQLESNELTQIQTHVDLIQRGYRKTESQQYATRELENDLRDFITNMVRDKGGDLFVHLRAIKPEDRRKVRENSRVKFSIEDSEKGPEATRITII